MPTIDERAHYRRHEWSCWVCQRDLNVNEDNAWIMTRGGSDFKAVCDPCGQTDWAAVRTQRVEEKQATSEAIDKLRDLADYVERRK